MKTIVDKVYLTEKEAFERYGFTAGQLRYLRESNRIKVYKEKANGVRGKVYYREFDLQTIKKERDENGVVRKCTAHKPYKKRKEVIDKSKIIPEAMPAYITRSTLACLESNNSRKPTVASLNNEDLRVISKAVRYCALQYFKDEAVEKYMAPYGAAHLFVCYDMIAQMLKERK